ncbi:MAG: SUMF1/EgtB/PvdO family nonheme iron enzyme [Chloroflexi bacterium]|nr:SUMF1/EgtB/PvdO family nonheme iron enzyme [Chloroflexota bacterium]
MIPIPQELLEQTESGNVLLFIGERILRDAEGKAVIDTLTSQLAARCDIATEAPLSFPEATQAYEDEKGRQVLVQFLRDQLDEQGDALQQAHHLIAGLTNCRLLVTTCLDRRLERAFEQAGRPLDVITGNVDVAFEDERNAQLYKLRGSLDRPESLVLTEDDYETFFEDQASISVVLQGYLARKTILFVDYDLVDPHFKRLYRKVTTPLDDYARRAYAFGESPSPKVYRWCERHGVEMIEADATAFLESLSEQLTTRDWSAPVMSPQPTREFATLLPKRPYKLLDYYEAQDATIFFGRRNEIQHLTSLIHAHRLVLLYGASGTGKTSLLLAGVASRLERADPPYETIYVRALEDPSTVIRRAVRRKLPDAGLPADGDLVDFVAAATQALGRTLVIVLDQFEEFFIRLSVEFQQAFIADLSALYNALDVPVKVVLSLREDWLASVSEIEEHIPEVFRTKSRLLPLTRDQAHQAITAPVARLGTNYEPALIEQLLDDLTQGQGLTSKVRPSHSGRTGTAVMPPQLQLVCSALYNSLEANEHTITLTAYGQLGGARGVLLKYLDDEIARFNGNEQTLARDALEELVTSERTKAVKTGSELALALGVDRAKLVPVLEKMVRARLLRPVVHMESGIESAHTYELAHEYLIAEITLSPEAVARKQAEELLHQGVDNWQVFSALLPVETFDLIDAQRDRLRMDAEAQELMLRSGLRHGTSVAYWLTRVEDDEKALKLAQETLLTPQSEPARQSLSAVANNVEPKRLRALVDRLTVNWRQSRGTERACASDALWALRTYMPYLLRIQMLLYRSPRLMMRAAPLAAGVFLTGAFVIGLIIWGPRWLTPKPKIEWVDVPAGEFQMGSDPQIDSDAHDDEQPQHTVSLDAFHISKYEITNVQYAQCIRATVCTEIEEVTYYQNSDSANHPVTNVSWSDAKTFCTWIGGKLPTEAEWEYAARGPEEHIYPWGNDFDCSYGNFDDELQSDNYVVPGGEGCDGHIKIAPVGSFPAGESWCGALDMTGNVWEWVDDWYGDYPFGTQINPTGPAIGDYKVMRGGGWSDHHIYIRAAARVGVTPDDRFNVVGFRCTSTP